MAQLTAATTAADRLDATFARLERRLSRIAGTMASIDTAPISISPGQLRLVVGE